jgi:GNAT superfamily N-acetyltransferase
MIKEITWEETFSIWSQKLWPVRTSPIQTHSAMRFMGQYDMENKNTKVTFLGYFVNGELVGVNSGHGCKSIAVYGKNYRSRGLYVSPEFRKQGIGTALLKATTIQARYEGHEMIWSYPKIDSWDTYNKAGFSLATNWHLSETGMNAYAYCILE